MQFQGPPDIPVGSTGVLVNLVKGDVLIGPSNTQITFDLEYHDNSNLVDGAGTVTINTAGLFDLQTSGEVLAKVDYNGHAWVAWNPLDVGVDVHAWYSSWLQGQVHAYPTLTGAIGRAADVFAAETLPALHREAVRADAQLSAQRRAG